MKKIVIFLILCFTVYLGFSQTYFKSGILISNTDDAAASVFSADIDNDGDMDIFSCGYLNNTLGWYANNGNDSFAAENIISSAFSTPMFIYGADLDSDGDIDLLASSNEGGEIAWFENNGQGSFGNKIHIAGFARPRGIYACDIDKDSDVDIVACSYTDDFVAWYENDGSQNFTQHTLSSGADGAYSVFATDLDNDGDMDILSASRNNDWIAWYENDGSQNFTTHTISDSANGATGVYAADINNDGFTDVLAVACNDDQIIWFENDGNQNFTQHIISTEADYPNMIYAFDADNDGDMDVLVSSENDNSVSWFQNLGNGIFSERKIISQSASGVRGIHFSDLDGDGDFDVISASWNSDLVHWYENYTLEILQQPQNKLNVCGQSQINFITKIKDADSLHWFFSNDNGLTFNPLEENQFFSGCTSDTLKVFADTSLNNCLFFCKAINNAGSKNTDTVILSLETENPILTVHDTTIFLNDSGQAFLDPALVISFANDNCGILDTGLSQNIFTCSEVGENNVIVSLTDLSGNTVSQNIVVTVSDTLAPLVVVHVSGVYLDENGTGSIGLYDVLFYTSDNCAVQDTFAYPTNFDCNDSILSTVMVTAIDVNGNRTTQGSTVVVEDTIKPQVICPEDTTVQANENHVFIINTTDFDATATDNCSVDSLTNNYNNGFSLQGEELSEGTHNITWTAKDRFGNETSCSFTITVNQYTGFEIIDDFILKPNPSKGILLVEFPETIKGEITIFDLTGKEIYRKKIENKNVSLDLTNLPKGLYILNVKTPVFCKQKKLVLK